MWVREYMSYLANALRVHMERKIIIFISNLSSPASSKFYNYTMKNGISSEARVLSYSWATNQTLQMQWKIPTVLLLLRDWNKSTCCRELSHSLNKSYTSGLVLCLNNGQNQCLEKVCPLVAPETLAFLVKQSLHSSTHTGQDKRWQTLLQQIFDLAEWC